MKKLFLLAILFGSPQLLHAQASLSWSIHGTGCLKTMTSNLSQQWTDAGTAATAFSASEGAIVTSQQTQFATAVTAYLALYPTIPFSVNIARTVTYNGAGVPSINQVINISPVDATQLLGITCTA